MPGVVLEARDMPESPEIQKILTVVEETRNLVIEERKLNNSRFVQLSTGLHDLRSDFKQLRSEVKEQVDKTYQVLSEDIQAIVADVDRLKRKSA